MGEIKVNKYLFLNNKIGKAQKQGYDFAINELKKYMKDKTAISNKDLDFLYKYFMDKKQERKRK